MSGQVKALVSADRPVVRICAFSDVRSPDEYAETQFATQEDANVAVERLNEILQTATGLSLSASWGMRET
jgi:hypothetical protein